MKKLFPDDNSSKKGVLEFLDKKGFYIVLILCIAIVAGTAVFVSIQKAAADKRNYNADNRVIPEEDGIDSAADVAGSLSTEVTQPTQAVSGTDNKIASNSTTATKDNTTAKPKVTPTPKPKVVTPAKAPATKTTAEAKVTFEMPVSGDITFDYSVAKLVYSKTLDEWRVHEGIDIAADRGTNVKAAADGVVSEIKNDPRFGIIVILEHKNGLKTVYANLATDDMVSPNQKIAKGEIIGSVGDTAAFEAAEQSHLHFEVLKDNENVNPASYIPITQVKK